MARASFTQSRWVLLLGLWACPEPEPQPPEPKLAEGVFAPLGEILPSATAEQRATFARGKEVAKHRFTSLDGLGPQFNATFCVACHERPTLGGSAPRYRNFLLVGQRLSDGSFVATGVNGVQTQYEPHGAGRVPTDAATNVVATRNAIPFFGVGLLAELGSDEILKRADPDDADGDGISGRVNWDRGFAGRFGRKAQTVSIEGFIRGPLFNQLGITTNPLPDALKDALPVPSGGMSALVRSGLIGRTARGQAAAPDEPNADEDGVPDPEMSAQDLFDLVSFSMLLAAPLPDPPTADSEAGRVLFGALGCEGCHVPTLLGPRGLLPAYSDLLLHDMGPDLADGITMKEASGAEFKTQPLWGVAATGPYLHDGRADTLDDAIRWHGGEAARARDAYAALKASERAQVITFLESLGGKAVASPGLLPPDAPVPPLGEYGAATGGSTAQFVRGRALFDGDFGLGRGLGPRFNGDSCRACHFDPVIGGAGPNDVNVTRQGILANGAFREPAGGTMASKLSADVDARPPVDPEANIFEHRQTPPLFGLGLIDRIPAAVLQARADPDDQDGDGIRGVLRQLPDGRVGRLGWKANVPDLEAFARDAMTNELGITVPASSSPFGSASDTDAVADPEISAADLEDLVFYLRQLAPPPPQPMDPARRQGGRDLFAQVGCDRCHAELEADDGAVVPLYSDLLLHDVAPPNFVGITDGPATMRMFRTPPLWGLSTSAPYLHDGAAPTIEHAIARHEAEAAAARQAFEALAAPERALLLEFLGAL